MSDKPLDSDTIYTASNLISKSESNEIKWGGKRDGAGRPKGMKTAIKGLYADIREWVKDIENQEGLLENIIDVMENDPKGTARLAAVQTLLALGFPKTLEMTNKQIITLDADSIQEAYLKLLEAAELKRLEKEKPPELSSG